MISGANATEIIEGSAGILVTIVKRIKVKRYKTLQPKNNNFLLDLHRL